MLLPIHVICSISDRKPPDQVMRPGPLRKVSTSLNLWVLMLICDVLRYIIRYILGMNDPSLLSERQPQSSMHAKDKLTR